MARARTRKCDACYEKVNGYCGPCEAAYRDKNREKYRSRARSRSRKRRAETPDYVKSKILVTRYGIDLEERKSMEDRQEGKCLICNTIPRRLVIDHCHATGRVRGLLCDHCNTGLGSFKDCPDLLEKAIKYLKS